MLPTFGISPKNLLLTPRSAPEVVPRRVTSHVSSRPRRLPTRALLMRTRSRARSSLDFPFQRHPFSALTNSAGELLHTPYENFDFHDHLPAVITCQQLLRYLGERKFGILTRTTGSPHIVHSAYQNGPTKTRVFGVQVQESNLHG